MFIVIQLDDACYAGMHMRYIYIYRERVRRTLRQRQGDDKQ